MCPAFFPRKALLMAALSCSVCFAQEPQGGGAATGGAPAAGGAGGSTGGPPGGSAGGGGRSPGRQPSIGEQMPGNPRDRMQMPEMQRLIFLSGKVMLDDGTPPPESVLIERVCNGQPKPEGYTDSKGRFSFQLGQNNAVLADASVSNSDGLFGDGGPGASNGRFGGQSQINERQLMGCEIRAALPGFRSDVVTLAGRRSMDNPDLGTIVLHRLAKVDGFTFSATSAYAPKSARKAYEKGRGLAGKKKFPQAEKELQKAVGEYPKYAVAWYELGLVHQQQNKSEDARRAYAEALKADEKYVNPYAQLALLSVAEQKWDETIEWSDKLIKLNPFHSPHIYFYNAMANLNLKRLDEAEGSVREAVKLDPNARLPRTRYLLGVVLAQKGSFKESAENIRFYLDKAPDANDAETVKQQLAEVQRLITPQEASNKP